MSNSLKVKLLSSLEKVFLDEKKFVLKIIEENVERPITFKKYPINDDYLLSLRGKVNQLIKNKR